MRERDLWAGMTTRRQALRTLAATALAAALPANPRSLWAVELSDLWADLKRDPRFAPLKDLDGDFSWTPSTSVAVWNQRAEQVRQQVLVATGLWPRPTMLPLQPTVHGLVDRDEYTVERVYFESAPGLYVTGSLYRPKGVTGPRPAVLSPHGHALRGRFHDHGPEKIKSEIALGSEQFDPSGRYYQQARCVQLARLGCVVFQYDMLGYGDNSSLTNALIHGFAKQRPEASSTEDWGLFSAQSELRLLSALGLQTFNSVRAVDFLTSLPDVDASRIGVTGESGGGTQTFLLGIVDPRPAAFFPAVMVSTAMQGGCTCENASYLRIGTGNIELAALLAPRPLGMSAANDWTVDLERKGLPELKEHYKLLGVPGNVRGKHFAFEHGFNWPSRQFMYEFFNEHLQLGAEHPTEERPFTPLTDAEATVWTAEHPAPVPTLESERAILRWFAQDADAQLKQLTPQTPAALETYRSVVGGGWSVLVGRGLEPAGKVVAVANDQQPVPNGDRYRVLLRNTGPGEYTPAQFWMPHIWNGEVVLWVSGGSAPASVPGDELRPELLRLFKAGFAIGTCDPFLTGPFLAAGDGQPVTQTRSVANPREFLGYTTGYNHPLAAQRTHDVLNLLSFVTHHEQEPERVHLVGIGAAAPWAAAAAAAASQAVTRLAIASEGFRFGTITEIRDPQLWPGALKYGDLPGLLALHAPRPLWLADGADATLPTVLTSTWTAAEAPGAITLDRGEAATQFERLAGWFLV